jgi:hypothetical protein
VLARAGPAGRRLVAEIDARDLRLGPVPVMLGLSLGPAFLLSESICPLLDALVEIGVRHGADLVLARGATPHRLFGDQRALAVLVHAPWPTFISSLPSIVKVWPVT